MKFSKIMIITVPVVLATVTVLLSGCANPYDINACEGGRYQPSHYGSYPDSSYYDNDYYKNYEPDHFGLTDHRYDHTYGPNQLYHPSDRP